MISDCRPNTAALAVVLGVSGVLIAVTILGSWSDRPPGPLLALDIVVGALSWALAALTLWRPVAATAVLTVLAAVSPAATAPARIAEAVRQVAAGEPILSPRITRRLMDRVVVQAGAYARAKATLAALSPREHDVAVAIGRGHNNAEIATALDMTLATVKTHVSHILTKLDLDNRTQIALLAHDAGLV